MLCRCGAPRSVDRIDHDCDACGAHDARFVWVNNDTGNCYQLCESHFQMCEESPERVQAILTHETGPGATEQAPGIGASAPPPPPRYADDPTGDDVAADAPRALDYLRRTP